MCHFRKIVVYRSLPGTHQACNQQGGLQPQVAGHKPGVECCRSPRVNSQKRKWDGVGMPRCLALRRIPSDHFHRGLARGSKGLIVGPLPRFLSRPESLFASLFCPPARPSVPSNAPHSHSHTPRAMPPCHAVTVKK